MEPRVLLGTEAATYCGLKKRSFDKYVRAGSLPSPLPLGKPHKWDRKMLDVALDHLSGIELAKTPDNAEQAARRGLDEYQNALRHDA